jgi:hypothetical protein
MSGDIGKTQQAMLSVLPDSDSRTTRDLGEQLQRTQRQNACAVRALEQRGLVEVYWSGSTYPMSIWKPGGRQGFKDELPERIAWLRERDELPEHPPATPPPGMTRRCTRVRWLVAECGQCGGGPDYHSDGRCWR